MSLLTKKEFAEICGIETKELSVYISRGKVILTKGKIDDEKIENIDFAASKLGRQLRKIQDSNNDEEKSKDSDGSTSKYELEKQKKALEIEKTKKEIRLLSVKVEKLEGSLIPTDAVKGAVVIMAKSIHVSFKDAMDNFLMEVQKKANLSSKDVAGFRNKITFTINKAVDDAQIRAKKDITNIVREYSEVRGRGERK